MNNKKRDITIKILAIAFMLATIPAALGIVRLGALIFAKPEPWRWDYVYVSQSPRAECYHSSIKCEGLSHTKYAIDNIPLDEAEELGKRPCEYCLKKDKLHKYDKAFPWLIMPANVLLCIPLLLYDRRQARKKEKKNG